jgi:hypothetical protein
MLREECRKPRKRTGSVESVATSLGFCAIFASSSLERPVGAEEGRVEIPKIRPPGGGGDKMRRTFVVWIAFATISVVFAAPSVLAEPICLDGSFALVTTAEATALDSSIGSVDVNGDGYLCRTETANPDGSLSVQFMDDVDSSSQSFVCPPGFTAYNGLAPLDRNGNGLVCQKSVNCDLMGKQCKVITIDDHPAHP